MRAWIGIALLACSWLLGMDYYEPANRPAWLVVVVLGAVLLGGTICRMPERRDVALALILLLPVIAVAPWPYRAAPLLIALGLGLELAPIPRRWPAVLGRGAVAAGVVMLAQGLVLLAYAAHTARCHDLPSPLPWLVGGLARLVGADVAVDGPIVAIHSMRGVFRLAATWELLLDPLTLCFFTGGLVMLGLTAWSTFPSGRRWSPWLGGLRALALGIVAWLPIRLVLLVALFLQRSLRAGNDTVLDTMNQFLNPWVLLLLLAGPVLLAWRFCRFPISDFRFQIAMANPTSPTGNLQSEICNLKSQWHYPAALGLVALAVAVFTLAVDWDPVGRRKAGRVMMMERHCEWEPTIRPYDTKVYGEEGSYTYAAIDAYCGQYYEMLKLLESDPIDDEKLSQCDVLVIKTPTARYAREEIDAVGRFVRAGGGLLLIGDHTDVFKTSTILNDVSRRFGFTFRHDLLFHVGTPYVQHYQRPVAPHPIVQHVPRTRFAVSCSIDPQGSRGRAIVQSTGLWSLPPDYHAENFHPHAEYRPEMRYGAFVQLWSTRCGKGRVLAFTDSTIFSNFSTFEPGKAEFFRGMIEWLNHGNRLGDPRRWLLILGLVPAAVGLALIWRRKDAWLAAVAAGIFGWTVASGAIAAVHRQAMPVPEAVRPGVHVILDRTVSEVPLGEGGFCDESGGGFALVEQWIGRLGYYTARRSGAEAFSGDALVIVCPTKSVTREYREGLMRYVHDGGRVLIVDSLGSKGSTANSLLWPFGMTVDHAVSDKGDLKLADGWPAIPLPGACSVGGGEPFLRMNNTVVGAKVRYGKGTVTAIGFGSFFYDSNMGFSWMPKPDAKMLKRYEVLYSLVRSVLTDRPMTHPPEKQPQGEPSSESDEHAGR